VATCNQYSGRIHCSRFMDGGASSGSGAAHRLAQYQIIDRLGEGGMGTVYKARDTKLGRLVALKILHSLPEANDERRHRFLREARAASSLNHANIVTIYEIGLDRGTDFIAMEFVSGPTLDRIIPAGGMRLPLLLKLSIQIADALAAAHAVGIVHRDLKPANIIVTDSEHAKILDFGIAKLIDFTPTDPSAATQTLRQQTSEGTILGTVAYMSPEQAQGKPVDTRSEIFSFGSVLYEMTTGGRAFQAETELGTLGAILTTEPPATNAVTPGVPPELEQVIARCLRKDIQRRSQHMADVRIALEDLLERPLLGAQQHVMTRGHTKAIPRILLGVLVLFGAALPVTWLAARRSSPGQGLALTRLTSHFGFTTQPAISPDGQLLAYASDHSGAGSLDIWLQHIAGG
jgi:eukaryotic-like serine/threonine-protein kinase